MNNQLSKVRELAEKVNKKTATPKEQVELLHELNSIAKTVLVDLRKAKNKK